MSITLDSAGRATRARIADEGFLSKLRALAPTDTLIHSQAELDASLARVLAEHEEGADIHVFGYGSLIWNPALEHTQAIKAEIQGWHRSFCLRANVGRGCAERPGLMLALDEGGTCRGILLRISAEKMREELRLLWRREMLTGAYQARWVTARADSAAFRAITFVANRSHTRYTTGLPIERMAELINTGSGPLGTCREYFDSTLRAIEVLGIKDAGMERLRAAVAVQPRD